MSSGLLPDHIEPLVDRLRAGDHLPIAQPDVAAVTEILMRSLESYFKSIDLTLYKECKDLADYIEEARAEISSLSPDHDDSAGIPRAGQELDAIVEATESATDTIMQAAEDLMSFDTEDFDEYKNHINDEVMKIFEACSFQDITGQRISKVVKTLNHVEDRVNKLISILGITSDSSTSNGAKPIIDPETGELNGESNDEDLLNGPALAGEGIDQGEIDSLLNDDVTETSEPISEETPAEGPALKKMALETSDDEIKNDDLLAENNMEEAETPEVVESKQEEKKAANAEVEIPASNQNEETSQNDIDSLFA
ncbi:protein phosphatase CheZ [Pseudemcibacter sp.]|uniref:protein phosphatase CheZ n=1 Tax=Pseudemcibacter sp. TaxID=2943293 RepID=UPI003F697F3C